MLDETSVVSVEEAVEVPEAVVSEVVVAALAEVFVEEAVVSPETLEGEAEALEDVSLEGAGVPCTVGMVGTTSGIVFGSIGGPLSSS